MNKTGFFASANLLLIFLIYCSGPLFAQDRYDLKAPNGISFSEIKGYETWPFVAPSRRTDNNELRIILGNTVMINAYKGGIPGDGSPFPEGSTIVKIGWSERQSPVFPPAFVPDVLKRVEFITKDSKRFPATSACRAGRPRPAHLPRKRREMERKLAGEWRLPTGCGTYPAGLIPCWTKPIVADHPS